MKLCLHCGKPFKSKHPSQKFCSHKGAGNCKDRHHNTVDPKRQARVGIYANNAIDWDTVEEGHPFSSDALGQD